MADALSIIPASVLRNLADKLYEKRKNAAIEVRNVSFLCSSANFSTFFRFFGNWSSKLVLNLLSR